MKRKVAEGNGRWGQVFHFSSLRLPRLASAFDHCPQLASDLPEPPAFMLQNVRPDPGCSTLKAPPPPHHCTQLSIPDNMKP